MDAAVGVILGFLFMAMVLGVIGLVAHIASTLIYRHLIGEGSAHASTFRVISFIFIAVGILFTLVYTCVTNFRFGR